MIDSINWEKVQGLIPAIIQDEKTNQVLMLGYMNRETLQKTLETKRVTFFSRTKNREWVKGETSGHYLVVKKISLDCDQDTILIKAIPLGPTCHLGMISCFGLDEDLSSHSFDLEKLEQIIESRSLSLDQSSYTKKLLEGNINRLIQKIGEEGVEVVIAAKNNDKEEIMNEVSDLLYHTLVLLKRFDVGLKDIYQCLEGRHK